MDIRGADPRDQTWEFGKPTYRVYFHDAARASDEYEVAGADVAEVIDWAESHKGSGTYVLYACVPRDGLGLVRLAGVDPNAASQRPSTGR